MKLKENGLNIKVEHDTKDYLGCEILVDEEKECMWLEQPFIIKKMLSRFADIIGVSQLKYKTPVTPGFGIIRPETIEDQISPDDQAIYRECVGTLVYQIKYSQPDIANVVWDLSNCMDKATPSAFKEMKRVMQFISSPKDYGLHIKPDQSNGICHLR
jgi:hypothetical protein